jgi:hypothetical protein
MRRARGALLLALAARAAAAEEGGLGDVEAVVRVFTEPAPSQAVTVVTPLVAGRADVTRWLSLGVDWNADIVTGATPRTYGAPDAVTGATRFSELRNALGVRAAARTGPLTGEAAYHYSFENDYRSHLLVAGAQLDLAHHATVVAAEYARNFDSVCDLANGALAATLRQPLSTSAGCFSGHAGLTEEPLAIDSAELSLTQALTPRLVTALVGGYQHLDGFQSNPYRRVRLDGGAIEAQESHPRLRDRGSLGVRARIAATQHAALGLDLRLYRDSWAIESLTAEATWEQLFLDERLRLRVRARGYVQSSASFYRDAGAADSYERAGPVGDLFTGDRELAPFADLLVGARLGWRVHSRPGRRLARLFTDTEVTLRIDLMKWFTLSPEPPNAARMRGVVDAVVAGLSATGRF